MMEKIVVIETFATADEDATNYNPDANCDTGCEFEVEGCTDPCAPNYDPDAEDDDGSCEDYEGEDGCNRDICDGDVIVESVLGCTDSDATNYDPSANCDDGSCEDEPEGDYDLSLIMGISSSYGTEYCPGDVVRINMAIYNQGDIDACDVEVSVYIPDGLTLSSHSSNSIWSGDGDVITTTIASCVEDGRAYPNDSRFPLSVRFVVDEDFEGSSITAYAEISSDDGRDVDSSPDDDPDNDRGADASTGTDNTIHGQNGDEDDHDGQEITIDEDCLVANNTTWRLGKIESVSVLTLSVRGKFK